MGVPCPSGFPEAMALVFPLHQLVGTCRKPSATVAAAVAVGGGAVAGKDLAWTPLVSQSASSLPSIHCDAGPGSHGQFQAKPLPKLTQEPVL